jgi:hypothetical protein
MLYSRRALDSKVYAPPAPRAAKQLIGQVNEGDEIGANEFVESLLHGWEDQTGLINRRLDEAAQYQGLPVAPTMIPAGSDLELPEN